MRGRGLDLVTIMRDHELLKWIGANAYRTSHYPYSDEVLDIADKCVVNDTFYYLQLFDSGYKIFLL